MKRCKKKGVYICFEGLDGSGKSTLVANLYSELKKYDLTIDTICPTKALNEKNASILERVYKKFKILERSRVFRLFLYANRSNKSHLETNWNADVILGDRSIITSYVVNWTNSKIFNLVKLGIVNILENKIEAPDIVFFINVSYSELDNRLNSRSFKRDIDETLIRAKEMKLAYDAIMYNKKISRIREINWHIIDGDKSQETVLNEVEKMVLEILKEKKILS